MGHFKNIFLVLKETFSEFSDDNVLKLSAALSYYTVFSLAPMLLLIISIVSFFFGREAFEGELYGQIRGLLGTQAATQLQELIKNAAISDKSTTAAIIGGVTLLIGATGVFAEIQDSINYIWSIKSKPRKGWVQYLKNRLLSFSMIVTLGFLLVVTLGVNTVVDLLSARLEHYFSEVSVIIFSVLNVVLVLVIITALFAVVFKILPDGHVRWKECLIGAGFTSLLFAIGKLAISFYLGSSDLGATYGASASIVILLTWIYYSSIILYFGAEFTKVYAKSDGHEITPNEHAVLMVRQEVQQPAGGDPSSKKESFSLNPAVLSNTLFQRVSHFIDEKLDSIRAEINNKVSRATSPIVYYLLMSLLGFVILVTILVIAGHFLNSWLDSDYLGFVILLALMVIALVVHLLFRKQFQQLISKLLFRLGKGK
ncbi:YihY/virulence factor BrkB family protein [Dyadobacter sp. CY261]|uniref:YihY/virulence factor BrkB family protein n=1 Tax=Dyadobacter sp. CY261 TaxID=2907203 RepID=UPI001F40ABDC|nr:YihY/virulence factor BrkB family protein [Dyadobacter sp. CY261]MCF0069618.1 YihY/virulence factor BrkB family protein [Dyadobacter sp. CY261]